MLPIQADNNQPEHKLEETEGGVEEGFGRVAGCVCVEGEHFLACCCCCCFRGAGFVEVDRGRGRIVLLLVLLFGGSVFFGLGEAGFEEFEDEEPHLFFWLVFCSRKRMWYEMWN